MTPKETHIKDGAALAAIFSAGLGCFTIGLATVLSEMSPTIKDLLNWWNPAGPLTGKTGLGVLVWLIAWGIFHFAWHRQELSFGKIWRLSFILILIGWLGTFPPFFDLFAK